MVKEVRRYFPSRIYRAIVPRSIRLAEAPSFGQAIGEYDAASRGGQAYRQFVEELVERLRLPAPPARAAPAGNGVGQGRPDQAARAAAGRTADETGGGRREA